MICKTECHKTAALSGPGGGRIMISQPGNPKFLAGTPHPQCADCAAGEYQSMLEDIQKLKDANVLGPGMAAEWERLQAKTKKVLAGSK